MPNDPSEISGAEEYVTAEIELAAPLDPEQEKSLLDLLARIDRMAFQSCDVSTEKISIAYDPTRTKQKDLLELIKRAGGKLKHVESEGSPLL